MNRGLEISADAADAANSLILDQVAAGVAVRMSVLYELLGGDDEELPVGGRGGQTAGHRLPVGQSVPEGVGV
jgi:aspartate carbamoyltransferase catalytic subunit